MGRLLISLALKVFALLVVAAVITGIVYEQIGRYEDRARYPQIGRSVNLGGRTLNICCSGEGGPAVIFESGAGMPGYGWVTVQPEVAKFTRACWYDRAGYGWSDPGPRPRTAASIAEDLHELLRAAGVAPPYILVAASFGGMISRVYAGKYPSDVAGLVLVDSAHEDQDQYTPQSALSPANRPPGPVRSLLAALLPAMSRIGAVRFVVGRTGRRTTRVKGLENDQATLLQNLSEAPGSLIASAYEGIDGENNAEQVRAAGNLGNRPLIVLTAGQAFTSPDPVKAKELDAFRDIWRNKLQAQLARLSTRGRQVVIQNSGHGIQYDAPDAVIAAVREVVTQVRAVRAGHADR